MFSGTSSISATIAKLCSSSSILSSLIVKNVDTANVVLSAGIITIMEESLKSGSGGSENERKHLNIFQSTFTVTALLVKERCISLQYKLI